MSPNKFWRVAPSALQYLSESQEKVTIDEPRDLIHKLKPRHGLVVASWDASGQFGRVHKLGVVTAIHQDDASADVELRSADITLRPNPSGRRYWSQSTPFFGFAPDVVARYMLADLFAEHFPEFSDIDFGPSPKRAISELRPSAAPTGGFVYVISSPHGYKIGKTVNLRARTRLFAVKLPFPISIEHYAWFEDYSIAEREFHRQFQSKRKEGEWFDLSSADLLQIKTKGKRVPVDGL